MTLAGCTAKHYRHSADKAAYGLIAQKSPLVTNMERHFTIEETNQINLEGLPVTSGTNDFLGDAAQAEIGAKVLSLDKALELAVKHSRTYQNNKEQLYLTALSLSLARHQFTPIFSAGVSGTYTVNTFPKIGPQTNIFGELVVHNDEFTEARSVHASGSVGVDWLIRDIGRITAAFTTDFFRYVSGNPMSIVQSQLAATFRRPLLRDAGFKTDIEILTQSERNLLYGIRDFVRFRKDFSVLVASSYYGVLGFRDTARNSFLNFQSSRKAGDRTRDLAAEGRTTQTDLGRIEQQELSSESTWVNAVRSYQRGLDDFKILLGIPVDSRIVLDDKELEQLRVHHPKINVDDAIRIALAARLDYQNVKDEEEDTVRKVALAADRFKPQLDVVADGRIKSPVKDHGFPLPEVSNYDWDVGATLDLPLERTAARNDYRAELIAQDHARRNVELQRDQIELQIRENWRTLEQAKRNYEINEIGVKLAERRVEEQELLAEFGRAKALDQVDAQNSLLSSKDQLTQALVAHTIARLQFWDNMGILYIKEDGQWEEMEETPRSARTSRSRRSEENPTSKKEQPESPEPSGVDGPKEQKRQRTAALQDLAEGVACYPSRRRLGVRLSSAALAPVGLQADATEPSSRNAITASSPLPSPPVEEGKSAPSSAPTN
jgi:outer membrane protein TolC